MNAALSGLARETVAAFVAALAESGLNAPLYLTQNDGTVMPAAVAQGLPILSFAHLLSLGERAQPGRPTTSR